MHLLMYKVSRHTASVDPSKKLSAQILLQNNNNIKDKKLTTQVDFVKKVIKSVSL